MREILFKAKRKNWRELPKEDWWVEGSYHHQTDYYGDRCDKHYIIDGTTTDMEGYGEHYEIDPETLCQYTGLKDKNGKRIWENDIVRCNRREKEAKYKVVWDKTYADFRIEKLNGLGIMPICIEEGNAPVFGRHYECIGNTFDNPELLKGDQSYADL